MNLFLFCNLRFFMNKHQNSAITCAIKSGILTLKVFVFE